MSFFIYPEEDSAIQSMLKQKATQLKAEIKEAAQKGITLDMEIEQQYRDVELIREKLTTREERYFETGYYVNLYEQDTKKLSETSKKFEQKVAGY
jgi:type IV secretory pathway VirB4 component